MQHVTSDLWLDLNTGAVLTSNELVETFENFSSNFYGNQFPTWFTRICSQINTRYAESHRLQGQIPAAPFRARYHSARRPIPVMPDTNVERLSSDLVAKIDIELKKYATVSQKLDSSFLKRLVKTGRDAHIGREELMKDLRQLEVERLEFVDLGLLDKDDDALDSDLKINQDDYRAVSIHIHDRKAKHSELADMGNRLRKLLDMVNDRFKFKRLAIDRQEGFVFRSPSGNVIPLERLSSGEQHELVLFYRLLFHVESNSLILIDEPEISLHVTWQRKFLNDLADVVALSSFDVLIATHSPQIVHDKYDWMVDLQNPEDELADDVVEYA